MIGALAFASCYVYSPTGNGSLCARSRLLRALLKEGDARFMIQYAVRVREQAQLSARLGGFFVAGDVLVPVPRSVPKTGGTWVAAELAQALVQQGLGAMTWPGLRRIRAVRKSATCAQGARPSIASHYESFRIEPPAFHLTSVVLIDDIVTKGRTLLAAASRLREAIPGVEIRAFALLRTMGRAGRVQRLLDPCRGEIRWARGDALRNP
ncbi:MAG TPA: phosphoribosyltransferase [Steroidobacteraceae bacterium]|jgi:predicted amidophosphoribosyltransferase|nr:phosphoribosyltransferase [Steroidobacteraceae bacterium]